MKIRESHINKARALVGDITEEDLRHVDCYVADDFGIFIPSVGFCQYAIRPSHVHPSYSFILYFSPEQCFIPVNIELKPEQYLVTAISPEVPHEEDPSEGFTRYVAIMINKEFYESVYRCYSNKIPAEYDWDQFLVPYDIMGLIKKFMAEYENKLPGEDHVLEALAKLITHQIVRSLLKIEFSKDNSTDRFEIERVIDYFHQNYGEKMSIGELAKIANMSESHFTRTFKKETGLAPMEYLIGVRLDKAKKLLRAGTMNITEISYQCGFNSLSHLSSCFTKRMGITPTKYQETYSE